MEGAIRKSFFSLEPNENVSLTYYIPLLTRATSETDEQTPGYMYAEIEKITYNHCYLCVQLVEFLGRKLEKPSPIVKFKVLKILSHLIHNGHAIFRNSLRENDASLKMATTYSGPPDPLIGTALYEEIRKLSKHLLNLLFDTSSVQKDSTFETAKVPMQLGALGSSKVIQGKYEGFGNSPNDKEETIKGKVIDILDKLIYPVDEKAEVIKFALTNNTGDYKPVIGQDLTFKESFKPQIQEIARTVRVHVPGRAAGGWESDNDEEEEFEKKPEVSQCELVAAKSESNISTDSLERIDLSNDVINPEQQIILEFCSKETPPNSVLDLNDICKRLPSSSLIVVLETVVDALQMSLATDVEKNNFKILRALLLIEWLLKNDLSLTSSINQLVSQQLNEIVNLDEKCHSDVKQKARKINLIVQKLQLIKL